MGQTIEIDARDQHAVVVHQIDSDGEGVALLEVTPEPDTDRHPSLTAAERNPSCARVDGLRIRDLQRRPPSATGRLKPFSISVRFWNRTATSQPFCNIPTTPLGPGALLSEQFRRQLRRGNRFPHERLLILLFQSRKFKEEQQQEWLNNWSRLERFESLLDEDSDGIGPLLPPRPSILGRTIR